MLRTEGLPRPGHFALIILASLHVLLGIGEPFLPSDLLGEVLTAYVNAFIVLLIGAILPMIAADPSQTGRGLGAALMKHALEIVDEAGLPAYLESSNPRNISLYERHGFEVMGEIQTVSSPVMTPMYRAARR